MRWSKCLAAGLVGVYITLTLASASELPVPFVHKKKYVMGTVFEIVAYDPSPTHASAAIDKAFQEIVRLDGVMSNYKSDSDLSRLNRSAHFHAQAVPLDLYRVIKESLRYSRLSRGRFDITVGPLVNLWKAEMRGERTPSAAEVAKLRNCVGYEKIALLPPNRIEFRSQCMQLDLGAIGKGYAVDRAVERLTSLGIRNALVNAGGSTIYGLNSPPGQSAWLVHLRDPSNQLDPQVMLRNNSVSTSEQTAPSLLGKDSPGHIIDPKKGLPLKTTFAVSVIAETATASDGLSTSLLLMGPEGGKAVVKTTENAAAIWISANGQFETASNGPQILTRRVQNAASHKQPESESPR